MATFTRYYIQWKRIKHKYFSHVVTSFNNPLEWPIENVAGKEENAGNQRVLFPLSFRPLKRRISC